ncbi:hypothetical protein SprV_0100147900 [Sparganum proliferum]
MGAHKTLSCKFPTNCTINCLVCDRSRLYRRFPRNGLTANAASLSALHCRIEFFWTVLWVVSAVPTFRILLDALLSAASSS